MQSEKAELAYFTIKQMLPFSFAEQYTSVVMIITPCLYEIINMIEVRNTEPRSERVSMRGGRL